MPRTWTREGGYGHWFLLLICLSLTEFGISSRAQNSLNVTNYGAIGDAVQFYVNTTSNSVLVTTTNFAASLPSADKENQRPNTS
jgi:hypothetical protein